jgi:hypothetical protein
MKSIFTKNIKLGLLYITILILLIEIIKIRPIPRGSSNQDTVTENYENYENKLKSEIKDFSKQQKVLKANVTNHTKYLKIKQINFADSSHSKILYKNSPYLNSMNKVNLTARKFKNIEDATTKYINDSLVGISDDEKEAFLWVIEKILNEFKMNVVVYNFIKYYVYDDENKNKHKVIIAKSADWLEYNMPHTHNDVIILTSDWFSDIMKKYKRGFVNSMLLNEGMTFIHELIHIHQRIYMKKYETFLYSEWGFIKANYIHNIKEFIYMNRLNPDGQKLDWIWNVNNKYYLIGAIYESENPSSLISVSNKLVELNKTDTNVFSYASNNINNNSGILLSSSDLFMDYFGITNNNYHPNEIAAQYMEYYFSDILGDKILGDDYEGYNVFKKNIKKILTI